MSVSISVYESGSLQGVTGDNGERYCVMFRNHLNPLASFWIWRDSAKAAHEIVSAYREREANGNRTNQP